MMPNWQNAHFPFRKEVDVLNSQSLRENAADFIVYKRSIGYMYDDSERLLNRYVDYAEKAEAGIRYPTKAVTDNYLAKISHARGTLYGSVAVLREFSRFLQARGYRGAYMIPPKTASQPIPEDPYFFTEEEISAFFRELDLIKPNKSFKGRELVIPALFRLLYCCGLRCKEARMLQCRDVHLGELYIDVMQSKGPKSRRIFISQELSDYLSGYEESINLLFPGREYFFPSSAGFYSSTAVSANFRRFWQKAFPDFAITTRPRAYDFRHHFAWANLNRWAAEGLDVNAMLPYLMRYMGHQSVSETLYYFHFVPEFFPTYKSMSAPLEDLLPEVPE